MLSGILVGVYLQASYLLLECVSGGFLHKIWHPLSSGNKISLLYQLRKIHPMQRFCAIFGHGTNWPFTFQRFGKYNVGAVSSENNVFLQLSLRCWHAHSTRLCLWASVNIGNAFEYPWAHEWSKLSCATRQHPYLTLCLAMNFLFHKCNIHWCCVSWTLCLYNKQCKYTPDYHVYFSFYISRIGRVRRVYVA